MGKRVLWNAVSFEIRDGDNGSGKTTLIKKIINQDAGISISPAMKIGYFSQNLDILDTNQSILENVRTTSNHDETLIRTVLAILHFLEKTFIKQSIC